MTAFPTTSFLLKARPGLPVQAALSADAPCKQNVGNLPPLKFNHGSSSALGHRHLRGHLHVVFGVIVEGWQANHSLLRGVCRMLQESQFPWDTQPGSLG